MLVLPVQPDRWETCRKVIASRAGGHINMLIPSALSYHQNVLTAERLMAMIFIPR
jgi:hypothetical protein